MDESQKLIKHMAEHIEVRKLVLAAFLDLTDGLGMASDKDIARAWAAAFYSAGMTPTLHEFDNLGTHRVNMYEFVPALQSVFWSGSNG